jgi:hypothetical protein
VRRHAKRGMLFKTAASTSSAPARATSWAISEPSFGLCRVSLIYSSRIHDMRGSTILLVMLGVNIFVVDEELFW